MRARGPLGEIGPSLKRSRARRYVDNRLAQIGRYGRGAAVAPLSLVRVRSTVGASPGETEKEKEKEKRTIEK